VRACMWPAVMWVWVQSDLSWKHGGKKRLLLIHVLVPTPLPEQHPLSLSPSPPPPPHDVGRVCVCGLKLMSLPCAVVTLVFPGLVRAGSRLLTT
jgi:hypothetical protein